MTGTTHTLISVSIGYMLDAPPEAFPLLVLGGLLPDCDLERTKISKYVPLWVITTHRELTHSILMLMLMYVANPYIGIAYFLHIVCDLLNKKKLRLFYPFKGGIAFNLIKYNGLLENIIKFILVVYIFYFNGLAYTKLPYYFTLGLKTIVLFITKSLG